MSEFEKGTFVSFQPEDKLRYGIVVNTDGGGNRGLYIFNREVLAPWPSAVYY